MGKKSRSFLPAEKAERRATMLNRMSLGKNTPISYAAEINEQTGEGRVVQLCQRTTKGGRAEGHPVVVAIAH